MLDIGWMEMAVIAVIALLVVGPRELPRVIKGVTDFLAKARAMAREFKSGLDDIARETELASLKNDMQKVADQASGYDSGPTDEAASTHDWSSDEWSGDWSSDPDHDAFWGGASAWRRRIEPGEGARKNPRRAKKEGNTRLKHRQGPAPGRRKYRS